MNDTRSVTPRPWKLAAGAILALALGAWPLACTSGGEEEQAPAESKGAEVAEPKAGPGSVVTLDPASLQLAAIELVAAAAPGSTGLVANGTISFDANHVSLVAPRAEGRVTEVRADLGQAVRAGSVLAILESTEVGEARGALTRAAASLEVAKLGAEREQSLFEQRVSSQKEALEARAAYLSAQADYDAAQARVRALGAADGSPGGGSYPLVSPLGGTVVERNATPGQIAGPEAHLFTVADLRLLWIDVDVYEADADRVRNGALASVVTRSIPGKSFEGRVAYAGGIVDAETRTVKVRVEVDNHEARLRPGMYAEVRLETPADEASGSDTGSAVVIPELAVQDLEGQSVVFVPAGPPGEFAARAVTPGPRLAGGLLTITSGLAVGERFVARGAFQLKSELLKGSFGDDD